MSFEKLRTLAAKVKEVSEIVQGTLSVKGGLYVDAFAIAVLVRLLGPLWGYPAMTIQEAGLWASTIAAFAYSDTNKPGGNA